jgi:transposase-like protein
MGARGPKSKFEGAACPNMKCQMYGLMGNGNVVGNGTYQTKSGNVRKFICRACGRTFSERSNTVFFNLRSDDKEMMRALKMVLKGSSLRATAEIMEVHLDTVRAWLRRAAEHGEEVNQVLLKEMNVSKVELDELWTFVQKKQFREWTATRITGPGSGPR